MSINYFKVCVHIKLCVENNVDVLTTCIKLTLLCILSNLLSATIIYDNLRDECSDVKK